MRFCTYLIFITNSFAFHQISIILNSLQRLSIFQKRGRRKASLRNGVIGYELGAVRVWVEVAEAGFVDHDENLMHGEICLRAVKAFAEWDSNSCGKSDPQNKFGFDYRGEERILLTAGALVRRPSPSKICDAWIADSLLDEKNVQVEGAVQVLDDLFYHHLTTSSETALDDIISTFVVQSGSLNSEYHCASYMAALSRGFKPIKDLVYEEAQLGVNHWKTIDKDEEDLDALVFDMKTVCNYAQGEHKVDSKSSMVAELLFRITQSEKRSILD